MDRRNDGELMEMLDSKETFDKMAKVNGVLWYEHVVRKDDGNVLKKPKLAKYLTTQVRVLLVSDADE